jgi:hypothetical protein
MHDPKLKLRRFTPPRRSRRAVWLGYAAGMLSRLRRRRPHPVTPDDLRIHDHRTSTQRMGARFTERIRDTFRFRWIRRRKTKGRENEDT